MAIHRTIGWSDLFGIFREAAEISAIIMIVLGLASIFSYSVSTLGLADPAARFITASGLGSTGTLLLLLLLLLVVGMFLDGVSIFMIFIPLLMPLVVAFQWDVVWFGVILTMALAIGQFTPPLAVNLMVSCKMAGVPLEASIPWVTWLVVSFILATLLVVFIPELALWLPRALGY
jgi:TRAP-type C4-dicarboxylate transport system permease large subunit